MRMSSGFSTLILTLVLAVHGNTSKPGNQPNRPGYPPVPSLEIQFMLICITMTVSLYIGSISGKRI